MAGKLSCNSSGRMEKANISLTETFLQKTRHAPLLRSLSLFKRTHPMKFVPDGIPLKAALLGFFAVGIVLAVGLVALFTFYGGKLAVSAATDQLRGEIIERISEHAQEYFRVPLMINQVNARAIGQESGLAADQRTLTARFAEQIDLFPSVTSIYFGNAAGGLANSGREPLDDSRYIIVTDGFQPGPFRKIALDAAGRPGRELMVVPDFDARTRPWHARAGAEGRSVYSDIYILFTGQDMALAASRPVYDPQGAFLGVVSVDLFLSHLSEFLRNLRIGITGQAFIMERSGKLVASSEGQALLVGREPSDSRRVHGLESDDPVIREAAGALIVRFTDLGRIQGDQYLEFQVNGHKHLLQATPLPVAPGIDWLVAVSFPEADFMAAITDRHRTTILLTLGILTLALLAGLIVARGIVRPISLLDRAVGILASGSGSVAIADASSFMEVRNLTRSFNRMSATLSGTIQALNDELTERGRIEEALLESEEMQRRLLQTVPDLIIRTDLDGTITFVNEMAFPGMRNHPEASISGTNMFDLIAESDRCRAVENCRSRLEKDIGPREYRLRFNEAVMDAEINGAVIRDKEARPVGMVFVIRDITERKLAEREQEMLQFQFLQAQKMETVGILAGGVAHDFNNLLHVMRCNIELLLRGKTREHPDANRLDNVIRSMDRAGQLVRQLLLFSRKSDIRKARVDLNREVEHLGRILERTMPKMIDLRLKLDPAAKIILADPVQIEQILLNLVGNSVDAMPEGGIFEVETGNAALDEDFVSRHPGSTVGPHVLLSVTDTGQGMNEEVLRHVFDPFFTTKEVGKGTGLGLASVYGIVKAHGGYIQCISKPNQGTTFRIYWPSVPLEADLPPVEAPQTAEPRGGMETILVVDDEPEIRELTREALEMLGYIVQEAATGEEALAVYQEHVGGIDLVLLDLNMPGMGGHKCLQELMVLDPTVKTIIASGYTVNTSGKDALASGAKGFLGKPFQLKELAKKVQEVLAGQADNRPYGNCSTTPGSS